MDYWNTAEAEIKGPYLFIHSSSADCTLRKGAPVLLHRSQAPFRKPGDDREWVTITPLAVQEYHARGERRERRVPMFEGSHPRIVIPAVHIRMKVRIIRDFVPGVPEYDRITAIGADTPLRTTIFRKGDVAIWDDFTMRPSVVIKLRCDMANEHGLVSDNPTPNALKVRANGNFASHVNLAFIMGFDKELFRKPKFRSLRR
ncbi:hypothetical protein CGRA01v4_09122 [Colletotrichum graminicola]|uniref:Uncharacterized protein n=1 Tax=Colletotrichum graminicola (strain M1.001 / M2 / FGSC 10212) TaxID=645133 RepID=E3Q727_COLGM|nr:uncharacterized protein GLRG_02485 [Colletotrichum graminicola M1.001]EFQ26665.1 hypothetical protein GLRG_02485 [Colletotrichum graminicola M1.001]WDK17837.1 hypothetical protein CGRA01v4_09122 [Colletotrichum graminicola]